MDNKKIVDYLFDENDNNLNKDELIMKYLEKLEEAYNLDDEEFISETKSKLKELGINIDEEE